MNVYEQNCECNTLLNQGLWDSTAMHPVSCFGSQNNIIKFHDDRRPISCRPFLLHTNIIFKLIFNDKIYYKFRYCIQVRSCCDFVIKKYCTLLSWNSTFLFSVLIKTMNFNNQLHSENITDKVCLHSHCVLLPNYRWLTTYERCALFTANYRWNSVIAFVIDVYSSDWMH